MKLFSKKKPDGAAVQTAPTAAVSHPFSELYGYVPLRRGELSLYRSLREAVPVIDAAISKIVRLIGRFDVTVDNAQAEESLRSFLRTVKVGPSGVGIYTFLSAYFDQLLTFGTAAGEMVCDDSGRILALYNAALEDIELCEGDSPLELIVCVPSCGAAAAVPHQERVLVSLLNPTPGRLEGNSILSGLPFVSSILLKMFHTMGVNFERVGNVRFAVTYRPSAGASGVNAKLRAEEIAREWTRAMRDDHHVSDFISVGDVSIKAIGADNQILDYDVPVRHILEQIVSKLSIPPFLLGFSWSSTERMSSQQADILTSELEHYRILLEPVIARICRTYLLTNGYSDTVDIVWENISLQDETELAHARLENARAAQLEQQTEVKE